MPWLLEACVENLLVVWWLDDSKQSCQIALRPKRQRVGAWGVSGAKLSLPVDLDRVPRREVELRFLLLMLYFLGANANAAELKQIKVFVGEEHARILLIGDEPFNRPTTRTNPSVGKAPARALIQIRGASVDNDLKSAYGEEHGRWLIPVQRKGVQQVTLARVSNTLQIGVETDKARNLTVQSVGRRALLIDLLSEGASQDTSLPSAEILTSWVSGISLKRRAQESSGRKRRLVVLDAGHGGHDPGAVGVSGVREADVALSLTHRLKKALENRMDVEVVLTRDDDTFIPLQERAAIANALDADLFVSVHANASRTSKRWGIETYYMDAASGAAAAKVAERENAYAQGEKAQNLLTDLFVTGTNRLSRNLANEVQSTVIRRVTETFGEKQTRDQGVHTALFAVLVWTRMPAILFESSYVSNPEDEMRLRTPLYQQTLAEAMAEGIERWFEVKER